MALEAAPEPVGHIVLSLNQHLSLQTLKYFIVLESSFFFTAGTAGIPRITFLRSRTSVSS